MGFIIKLVSLILLAYVTSIYCKKQFAGPYDVVFRNAYFCGNVKEDTFIYPLKFSKINRTHLVYNNNVTLRRAVDDNLRGHVSFSVFGNGGWQDNFMQFSFLKFCSDTQRLVPGLLESILKAAGRDNLNCPVEAGTYEIKNWLFKVGFAMKVFPYGKYKVNLKGYDKEKLLTCCHIEIDIVEKRNQ